MQEHHVDRAVYRRRRLVLAGVLVGLIALVWVLIAQLTGPDDSASPDDTAGSAAVSSASTASAASEPPGPSEAIATSAAPVTTDPVEATEPSARATGSTTPAPTADDAPTSSPPATELATIAPATSPAPTEPAATAPPETTTPTSASPPPSPAETTPTTPPPTTPPPTTPPPTTTPPTLPDTPPNEIGVGWEDDGAVLTGLIESPAAVAVVRDVVDEVALGVPIEDRTVVDPTIDVDALTVVIEDLRGVGFDRDVYDEVSPELAETLDRVAVVLEQYPDAEVVLIGHAITDGDDAADRAAAIERAATARAYLMGAGVDGDRVDTFGAGEDGAVPATGSTSINRRIDYIFGGLPTA